MENGTAIVRSKSMWGNMKGNARFTMSKA